MELVWCGLKLFVDCIDFCENNKVEIFYVIKDELLEDFEFVLEMV